MISVIINTKNEEKNLPRALNSVKGFADEVVVVDMHSTDKTQEIAKKAGAKVYEYQDVDYVEPARNFAIEKAKGDWIFILDADEELSKSLGRKLIELIKTDGKSFYRPPRKNLIFGKWIKHSRWWPDYQIKFFKKGSVTWPEEIHAVPETRGEGEDLEAIEENAVIHHNYQSVSQYLERLNRYTTIQVKEKQKKGETFSLTKLLQEPAQEFLSRYFAGQGYKDGLHGLVLAVLQAFSEFVVWLKLWQAEGFPEQSVTLEEVKQGSQRVGRDFQHWLFEKEIKEANFVKGLFLKLKRRLL
jgi:(heptosyl)LPS beta-1,4-glucosyltransferase